MSADAAAPGVPGDPELPAASLPGDPAPPAPDWCDGWWRGALALPSPNFGPRPAGSAVTLVVLHSISLPPGIYGGDEVVRLFTNTLDWDAHPYFDTIRGLEVSAHFFVRRDGRLVQFVSCDERAWHAGRSAWQGRENCNDYSVGIELEGLEGEPFDGLQYETLAALLRVLSARYQDVQVVGHEDIAPGRKQDPGAGFDWAGLRTRLGWHTSRFPAQPHGQ